jgi:ribonuclease T
MSPLPPITLATRFRGFLPVVVDLETGGFNSQTDALLEIAAVMVEMRSDGTLARGETFRFHVIPFPGSNMEPASMAVNGIDPYHPLRPAIAEDDALQRIFKEVRSAVRLADCTRAVLVGHNSHFDLGFLNAAIARTGIKRSPFHPFSSFDTATLGGVAFGQTVLMRATLAAGLEWDTESAHSAGYDAERSADLFCTVCNQFQGVFDSSRRRLASMGPLEVRPSSSAEAAAASADAANPLLGFSEALDRSTNETHGKSKG